MTKTTPAKTNLTLVAVTAFALSSCSYFDTNHTIEVEKSATDATTTEELVDRIPEGLVGDTENARQTGERLRNNDED